MSIVRLLACAALLGTSVACLEVEGGGDCDTSAASSVTVSVWDPFGAPVVPDGVFYDVDGLGELPCDPLPGVGHEFVCGWEETGWFDIRVTVDGMDWYTSLDVPLRPDGCHVDSRFVDVVVD